MPSSYLVSAGTYVKCYYKCQGSMLSCGYPYTRPHVEGWLPAGAQGRNAADVPGVALLPEHHGPH